MTNPLIEALMQALPALGGPLVQGAVQRPQGMSALGGPLAQAATPGQYPSIDLGTIGITKQANAMPAPQAPAPPVMAPPAPQASAPAQQSGGGIGEFLKYLGIPLATAAVGLAGGGNGVTAGAAGFSKGYGDSVEKQTEYKRKKELAEMGTPTYTFNPDTGQYEDTGVRIPKNAKIRNLTSEQMSAFQGMINKGLGGIDKPESKTTDQIKTETSRKYSIGQEIMVGDKKYKVSGFDGDEPLVDPI